MSFIRPTVGEFECCSRTVGTKHQAKAFRSRNKKCLQECTAADLEIKNNVRKKCSIYTSSLFTDSDFLLQWAISKRSVFTETYINIQNAHRKFVQIQCLQTNIYLLHKSYQQGSIRACVHVCKCTEMYS